MSLNSDYQNWSRVIQFVCLKSMALHLVWMKYCVFMLITCLIRRKKSLRLVGMTLSSPQNLSGGKERNTVHGLAK